MSRIGKKPISLPDGVQANVEGQLVKVKGPKGELDVTLVKEVEVALADGAVVVTPRDQSKQSRSLWGMSRSMVQNLVHGVSEGCTKTLEIKGVGYRAAMKGKALQLQLGLSHEVLYAVPEGVKVECPSQTEIIISGIDKQKVGQVAAEIRRFRPPEPFKGKGIRYKGEYIFRKEGKKK